MKIEAGKFYRTRDGRKVGPMQPYQGRRIVGDDRFVRQMNGSIYPGTPSAQDLIAEWSDEPAKPEYRVGDEIEIALSPRKITRIDRDTIYVEVGFWQPQEFGVDPSGVRSRIIRHIPAPRPIEVGCRVSDGEREWTVLAIDDGVAWLKKPSAHCPERATIVLRDLTRIDTEVPA